PSRPDFQPAAPKSGAVGGPNVGEGRASNTIRDTLMCRAYSALPFFHSLPSAYPPQHAKSRRAGDPGRAGLTSRRAYAAQATTAKAFFARLNSTQRLKLRAFAPPAFDGWRIFRPEFHPAAAKSGAVGARCWRRVGYQQRPARRGSHRSTKPAP